MSTIPSSYAKIFLASINKKAKQQRQSSNDDNKQEIRPSLKIEIEKVYDWKVVEEKYLYNNQICPIVNEQKDYVEILHEENVEEGDNSNGNSETNKEGLNDIASHSNAYNSPLNELFPLSRFNIEDNDNENIIDEQVAVNPQLSKEEEEKEENEEENKEDKDDGRDISRSKSLYRHKDDEDKSVLENDLNVSEDQMRDLKIEVKAIQKEYDKQQQMLAKKKYRLYQGNSQAILQPLNSKKQSNKLKNINNGNNEIEKSNNDVVVNNTNQYIISPYPNANINNMLLPQYLPPQIPMTNPLHPQITKDNSNSNPSDYQYQFSYQYPQPFYFNPSFPTQLPYIPPIYPPNNNTNTKHNTNLQQTNSNSNVNAVEFNSQLYPVSNDAKPINPKKEITYIPKTIKDYKSKYEGKNLKKRLGGLGPNIGTIEWKEKHQRAVKRKDYSDNVDSIKKIQNNIKIIHHDNRLNRKVKSNTKEEGEGENEAQNMNALLHADDSLNDSLNELPVNESLNKLDSNVDVESKVNVKESKCSAVKDNEHCITQGIKKENKKKNVQTKRKEYVPLPIINKRKTKSSSQHYHKYKDKGKGKENNNCKEGDEEEVQFTNEDLNRLYQNHQALISKVEHIKSTINK